MDEERTTLSDDEIETMEPGASPRAEVMDADQDDADADTEDADDSDTDDTDADSDTVDPS
jgi:hypothetical protein